MDALGRPRAARWRFFVAWGVPLSLMVAALHSGWMAWAVMLSVQLAVAAAEGVGAWRRSAPPGIEADRWTRLVLWGQVVLQSALLAWAVYLIGVRDMGGLEAVALGLAVGGTTGSQGITFAHELGHSRQRFERTLGWLLMGSVCYAHFMVEHYRGHHPRAATPDDPASARRGESLWRFLPRTLAGSWRSAWALEARQLQQRHRPWWRSPLAWATAAQLAGIVALATVAGPVALLFWLVQAAYAIFLLETVNYIEHYGLCRRARDGRFEPFGMQHAWNADHAPTNALLINLQRHSDHHMHAWKPFATLQALPGPQLPTGYAGCLFLATCPPLWFRVMHPRLDALEPAPALS